MTASTQLNAVVAGQVVETAQSLRKLYLIRTAFSVAWVILIALFAKTSMGIASGLLIIYPAWDVVGTFLDIRANHSSPSKMPQYVNAVISGITTIAVGIALQKGVPEALIVFGIWAVGTGLIQLILGLRRKKFLGGQWPMVISCAQSIIGEEALLLSFWHMTLQKELQVWRGMPLSVPSITCLQHFACPGQLTRLLQHKQNKGCKP